MYQADFINMNSLQSIIKSRFDQTRRDIFRVQAKQLKMNNLYVSLHRVISELVNGFIYPVLGFFLYLNLYPTGFFCPLIQNITC